MYNKVYTQQKKEIRKKKKVLIYSKDATKAYRKKRKENLR